MKEDYIFLVIVLIAIVAIAVTAGLSAFIGGWAPSEAPGEFTSFADFELGSVGYITELPAKLLHLGDLTIGEPQVEELKSISTLDISATLIGAEGREYKIDVPAWYFDTMEKLEISFDVIETNQYGPLVVRWNGKEFFTDKAYPRAYTIEIDPQYVEEQNTLEVTAGGPGFLFWASTVYKLKDFKVGLVYGPAKLYSFELFPNEMQSFNKGELSFYGTGSNALSIAVNGVEIYNKVPSGQETVSFTVDDVPLKTGSNIVALDTKPGLVNLFNTDLNVYLLTNQLTRERTFTISEEDWASLQARHGRIDYNIEAVNREGLLKIELNGNTLSSPTPVVGKNTVQFYPDQAVEGTNTLKFSSTGSFEITTVEVGMV